jgi:hypothetical protein
VVDQLKEGRNVVIIRHAYAPGNGGLDNFSIETNSFLNTFYDTRFQNNKDEQVIKLKEYIKKLQRKKNLILITHYVVISEILNVSSNLSEIILSDIKFNVIEKLKNIL